MFSRNGFLKTLLVGGIVTLGGLAYSVDNTTSSSAALVDGGAPAPNGGIAQRVAAPAVSGPRSTSACGSVTHAESYSYVISIPYTNPDTCIQGYGMRFETGAMAESLTSVLVYLSDFAGGPPEPGAEVTLELLADDGNGVPVPSAVYASTVIGGAGNESDLYPLGSFGYVTWPLTGIVLNSGTEYHVCVRWTGPVPHSAGTALGSDDLFTGEGDPSHRASVFSPGTYGIVDPACTPSFDGWRNLFATFDLNPDFKITVMSCEVGSLGSCITPPTNMVAWWPLDELVGSTAEDIVGPNDGTHTNSPIPTPLGNVAGALGFYTAEPGVCVVVPDDPSLNFGTTQDFTIDAWVNRKPIVSSAKNQLIPPQSGIVDKDGFDPTQAGSGGYALNLYNSELEFTISTPGGVTHYNSGLGFFPLESWHHVAVSVNRVNGGTIYYDGLPVFFFGATNGVNLTNTSPLLIGNLLDWVEDPGPGDANFGGYIDEVEIFNRALSDLEIDSIYQAGSFGKCKGGACCLSDGNCTFVNGQSECDSLGGFYWGDGSDCSPNPCVGQLMVCKFEDRNCNGIQDPNEPPLQGVVVHARGPAPSTYTYDGVTGANGCFEFGAGSIPAGTYKVWEDVPAGMAQTAPVSVFSTINLQAGTGAVVPAFGNADTTCTDTRHVDTCLAGRKDAYAQGDGPELAAPSAALCAILGNCSTGPRSNCNPASGNCSEFDCPGINKCFGHTFACWDCCVIDAQLCLRVRSAGGGNDAIHFMQNGVGVWGDSLSALNGSWGTGQDMTICLDLDNLPASSIPSYAGITNILAALQDGDLDVYIQDDTEIDYLELIVTTCCHCVEPPPDMVGWWPLDETAGPTARDVAIPGVYNNGTWMNNPQPSLGKVVGSLYFDGLDDRVEVPDELSLNGSNAITIDAWVNTDDLGGVSTYQNVVNKYSGSGYYLRLNPGGAVGFHARQSTQTGPNIIPANTWCHIAGTYDGATQKIYVNGTLVAIASATGPIANVTVPLVIGTTASVPHEAFFKGMIDEVELFSRALDSSEVASIWKADSLGKCRPCDCDCHADPVCDAVLSNVQDVVVTINVAFRGAAAMPDPNGSCPFETTDVNCDTFTSVLDVVKIVNVAFRGANAATEFCDPCP